MEPLTLRAWAESDFPLLQRANTPAMTAHLNGPESDQQLIERHERYLRLWSTGEARTFVILEDDLPVGSIGYWHTDWHGQPSFETGWFVLPEAQGRGVASAALTLLLADARSHRGEKRMLVASPGVENLASNGVCRRSGFTLVGTFAETFRDAELTMNEWVLDLTGGPVDRGPRL
ncbi:GNAT family N-acetyltransferase [Microbacterium aerolatum]|uniref:GNAT family N-acetyltransferase n=1 Tax=Microbacterium aerolatum TaxID=153731 RepID=UPI00384E131F